MLSMSTKVFLIAILCLIMSGSGETVVDSNSIVVEAKAAAMLMFVDIAARIRSTFVCAVGDASFGLWRALNPDDLLRCKFLETNVVLIPWWHRPSALIDLKDAPRP